MGLIAEDAGTFSGTFSETLRGRADEYASMMDKPWHRLRMELIWRTLQPSVIESGRWLDVGCGNGALAVRAVTSGHAVTLVDIDQGMLATAERNLRTVAPEGSWTILPLDGSGRTPLAQLQAETFDIVTAHNVLEYSDDRRSFLSAMADTVRLGGILSLVFANPVAVPLTTAVRTQDAERVLRALRGGDLVVGMAENRSLAPPLDHREMIREMTALGFELEGHFGLRIFNEVMTDERRKERPDWLDRMVELELAASDLEPYRSIARHHHLVLRRRRG